MEELQVKALDLAWGREAVEQLVRAILPATGEFLTIIEVVHHGQVLVVVRRCISRGGGVAPSFGEIWELYLISGPDRVVEHLSSLKGSIHRNRHIGVLCEETPTLLGSDIRIQVTVPDSMTDPRDPPPAFLIHIEGEKS